MSEKQENEIGIIEKKKEEVKKPKKYKVIIHNDDYTPFDFVISLLQKIFHKSELQAHIISIEIHTKGLAVAGVYIYSVAETLLYQTNQSIKEMGHPLLVFMEPEN